MMLRVVCLCLVVLLCVACGLCVMLKSVSILIPTLCSDVSKCPMGPICGWLGWSVVKMDVVPSFPCCSYAQRAALAVVASGGVFRYYPS